VDAPYDRERLTSAMVRKEGTLVPVDWQEAVTHIADRLKTKTISERLSAPSDGDNSSILFAVGPSLANEDVFAVKRLAQFLGAHVCGTDLSGVPIARRAIRKVLGNGYASNTLNFLADADLVWILAADLENFPQVASRLVQASQKGAKFVQLDVYTSSTLGGNTTAVPIPPYAFGFLPLLLQRAAFELDKISPRVKEAPGFSDFSLSMLPGKAPFLPDHPWLTDDRVKELASALLAARSPAVVIGERWLSISDGVRRTSELLQALALLGVEDRVVVAAGEAGSWGTCDVLQEETREGPSPLLELLGSESARKVSVLFVLGDDLVRRFPRSDALIERFSRIDTVVVIDRFQNDTLQFAHVALPSRAFGELDGTLTNAFGTVQRWRKAVSPQGESCPERVWMKRIGRCLGLEDWPFTPSQWLEALQAETPSYGSAALKDLYAVDGPFGIPVEETRRLAFAEPVAPVPITASEAFPMQLFFAAHPAHWSTGALSQREELLKREVIDSRLFVSPGDIKKIGLKPGDMVRVVTPTNEGLLSLREDTRLPEGVLIAVPLAGSQASTLRGSYPDPAGQTLGIQPVSARVEKV
jgi:predicted molibdopterin-dependent oxidoreductase YjgC